jgi:hypothetical protein
MRLSKEALVTATLRLLAPLFLATAVIGAFRNYSIVPFWDMWYGYLDFFFRASEGGWKEWWALHNEHRIVLSRVLFWMDLAWFDGTVRFLIAVNYLLVAGAFLTFRAILRDRAGALARTKPAALASLFVFICLFSWVQYENFVWGFQSQFFLAQWLPLLAFYLLYQSTVPSPASLRQFALACIVGVLCTGTMANGVVALPLMVAYALMQRMGWKRIAALALLSVVCLTVYFIDYQSTPGHGSVGEISQHPVKLLQYVLVYLGSPFYHWFGARSLPLAQLFGLVFVVLSAIRAAQCLRNPRQHALETCLLTFVVYIGGTALGTGVGRLVFGLTQAATGRYTTPALMGWMALLMLFLPTLLRSLAAWQNRIVWPLLTLLLSMTVYQAKATHSQRPALFEREVAALALDLGVRDDDQVGRVVYNTDVAIQISEKAAKADLSVFRLPSIRNARQVINRPGGALPAAACSGALTEVDAVARDPRYQRVTGWIAPAIGEDSISSVRLVNERMTPPPPVSASAQDRQRPRGQLFKGYLLSEFAWSPVTLAPTGAECSIRVERPLPPAFRVSPAGPSAPAVNVSLRNIVSHDGWTGTDFARSQLPGLKTIGSYVNGDSDTGELVLRLRRGAVIYYRSGPVSGKQLYRVDDGKLYAGQFPVIDPWAVLLFDSPRLPAEFTLTLSDAGGDWGEWSAIALQDIP